MKYTNDQLRSAVHEAVANGHESIARLQNDDHGQRDGKVIVRHHSISVYQSIASRLELTDAELALTTSQSNYLEAIYDYLSARIALNVYGEKSNE
ncbi:MAG: hypothetical protein WDN75_06695 [Bacteroidota bacterium]